MKIYKVGGYVRDTLLGLDPKDVDYVVVGTTPEEMLALNFEQVGADFPVFLHPETKDEYALARKETKIGDGYNGFTVDTENISLEEDLFRRDLTINAMAIDENNKIIDPYGGENDLKNKTLRHVSVHFKEDPVRILRVARFAARYDFTVATETLDFMKEMVANGEFDHLTKERVWKEFEKAFNEPFLDKFFFILKEINALEKLDPMLSNVDLSFIQSMSKDEDKYALKLWTIFSQTDESNLNKWAIPVNLKKDISQFKTYIANPVFYSGMEPISKLNFINNNKLIHNLDDKKSLFYGIIEFHNFSFLHQKDINYEFDILKSDIHKLKNIDYQELIASCEKGANVKEFVASHQIGILNNRKKFTI